MNGLKALHLQGGGTYKVSLITNKRVAWKNSKFEESENIFVEIFLRIYAFEIFSVIKKKLS